MSPPSQPTEAEFRARVIADEGVPAPIRSFLEAGARLEAIRLDDRGVWWHQGARFENARLAQLFHRSLARTDAGTWLLHIGRYSYPVLVDAWGSFVTDLTPRDAPTEATLADGSTVAFDPAGLATDGADVVTLTLPDGREARLVSHAWRVLEARLDLADGGDAGFVFRAADGRRCPIVSRDG